MYRKEIRRGLLVLYIKDDNEEKYKVTVKNNKYVPVTILYNTITDEMIKWKTEQIFVNLKIQIGASKYGFKLETEVRKNKNSLYWIPIDHKPIEITEFKHTTMQLINVGKMNFSHIYINIRIVNLGKPLPAYLVCRENKILIYCDNNWNSNIWMPYHEIYEVYLNNHNVAEPLPSIRKIYMKFTVLGGI